MPSACIAETSSAGSSTEQAPAPLVVSLSNSGFRPAHIRVAAGRTVRFVIEGTLSHSITGPGLTSTRLLKPGSSFECTFARSGELRDEVLSYVRGQVEILSSSPPPDPIAAIAAEAIDSLPTWDEGTEAAEAEASRRQLDEEMTAGSIAPVSAAFLDPGDRAGRWSGLSWETVQSRYKELKEHFTADGHGPSSAWGTGNDEEEDTDSPLRPPTAAGTPARPGSRARGPRPASSAKWRGPITVVRAPIVVDSSSSDDDDGQDDGGGTGEDAHLFAARRNRHKLESERVVLASRGGDAPASRGGDASGAAREGACEAAREGKLDVGATAASHKPAAAKPAARARRAQSPANRARRPPAPPEVATAAELAAGSERPRAAFADSPAARGVRAAREDGPGVWEVHDADSPSREATAIARATAVSSAYSAPLAPSAAAPAPARALAGSCSHACLQLRRSSHSTAAPPPQMSIGAAMSLGASASAASFMPMPSPTPALSSSMPPTPPVPPAPLPPTRRERPQQMQATSALGAEAAAGPLEVADAIASRGLGRTISAPMLGHEVPGRRPVPFGGVTHTSGTPQLGGGAGRWLRQARGDSGNAGGGVRDAWHGALPAAGGVRASKGGRRTDVGRKLPPLSTVADDGAATVCASDPSGSSQPPSR